MKRRVGRPKKIGPKLDRREVFMSTQEESQTIRQTAQRLGLDLSEAFRQAVREFVKRNSKK